ncbi:MAG: serine/threonine-protein kinase [Gemmataceae bacterium]
MPKSALTHALEPAMPSRAELPPAPAGYEILDVVGEGGMGAVYRARELQLRRLVALKVLRAPFARDAHAMRRFLYEAEVTAGLQHPGIPPIHQVGALPDGRPFLAMKLIHGQTLDRLLKDEGPGAARWLGVFEAICQAVAYAHSQGVIHRDLKPANIMVGAFGEVQVMDWGLAKLLGAGEASGALPGTAERASGMDPETTQIQVGPADPGATAVEAVSTRQEQHTQPGAVMGTPAFMPPEQALGAIDRLDRRSDVFGLGAVLCCLLTGDPPYVAALAEAVRQLAARARLDDAFARLDECGAEPDLVALARRCLAADPAQRPADAGELAAGVAELRRQAEERARRAELDRAQAEVRAAERHKRRRALRLAGLGLLAVLLCGIVGTTLGYWRAEAARRDEQLQREQAESARDQAKQRYLLALDAFNQMVFGIQEKLEKRPGTQELRKEVLAAARGGLRQLVAEAERQGNPSASLVWAHYRMGDVELTLGHTEAAQKEYQAGYELAQSLAVETSDETTVERNLAAGLDRLGNVTRRLGQLKDSLSYYQAALGRRQALAARPDADAETRSDLAVSLNQVGDVTLQMGRVSEAQEFFEQSLTLRQRLLLDRPEHGPYLRLLSISYNRMGDAVLLRGQTATALDYYHRALEIRRGLAEAEPDNAQAQRDLAVSYDNLGDVTRQLNRNAEALEHYRKSVEISQHLAREDPRNASAQMDLFFSYYKVGTGAMEAQAFALAREWLERAQTMLDEFEKKGWITGKRHMLGTWEIQQWKDDIRRQLATSQLGAQALARLDLTLGETPETTGDLLDLRLRALLKRGQLGDAIKTAECWRDWGRRLPAKHNEQSYNAACGFALCAAADEGSRREALLRQALGLLVTLREKGYFRDEKRRAHLALDRDLALLRNHPAYAAFAQSLRK